MTIRLSRRQFHVAAAAALVAAPALRAQGSLAKLRVKVFPGAQNLALYAALQQRFFEAQGLEVDLQFTQNSPELRNGLAAGQFEIAHAAVDNAVALREQSGADVVIVLGGDSGMNEFFVQPDITAAAQLRGRTLIVDAPNTAYALQARKVLQLAGLKAGDYEIKVVGGTFQRVGAMQAERSHAASALNPPFSFQARAAGLRSLGRMVELIGRYQGSGAFTLRPWAQANGALLERYIAGYVQGLRWAVAPQRRDEVTALLADKLKLAPPLAAQTYEALVDAKDGLAPDARFDREGFVNVLALRAELEGQWGGQAPAPERFYDLRWYEAALARINRPS